MILTLTNQTFTQTKIYKIYNYNSLLRNQTQTQITDFVLKTTELATMGNRDNNKEIISESSGEYDSRESKRMLVLSESLLINFRYYFFLSKS